MSFKAENFRLYGFVLLTAKIYTAVFIYIFMEWVFLVTKPSFLNYYSLMEKVSIIFLSPLILFLSLLLLLLAIYLIDEFLLKKYRYSLSRIITSGIYAAIIFLLVENFSNTVFGFYSGSFSGMVRYLYLLGFGGLFVVIYWKESGVTSKQVERIWLSPQVMTAMSAIILGFVFAILSMNEAVEVNLGFNIAGNQELPNILILSSDGINARNMSAYGYERETTPFIDSLLPKSLVFNNHFSNSAHTAGSVISLLTGKYPTTTRVIYQPDALRGNDSYEHLPGILQKLGYTNADISVRHYADTLDLNLLNGFHWANERQNIGNPLNDFFAPVFSKYPEHGVFLKQSLDRIFGRLLHITGIRDLEDVFETVTMPQLLDADTDIDIGRMQSLFRFMNETEAPFFVHLHLLGTHGPMFRPMRPLYSQGQEQVSVHMRDFYDDSIRDFDRYVFEVYKYLEELDMLDNTMVIINSDHSRNPDAELPIPLVIHFPENSVTGVIDNPSQRIDIAPTILEYIGITAPDWMEGQSLLAEERETPLIISVGSHSLAYVEEVGFEVTISQPPFYTLNSFYVFDCQHSYVMRVDRATFTNSEISGYVSPCPEELLFSEADIARKMLAHLAERNYEIGSLDWVLASYVDLERYFSSSNATLSGNNLYVPAINFRSTISAALFTRNDEGDFLLRENQPPLNQENVAVFDRSTRSLLFPQSDVNGEVLDLKLTIINDNPLRFDLEILE